MSYIENNLSSLNAAYSTYIRLAVWLKSNEYADSHYHCTSHASQLN